MGRLYRNPPIIEAVCEFRFEPSQPWDWTVIGLVYDRIKDEFPEKKQRNDIQLAIHAQGAEITQQVQMQFWREDKKALIQVGVDLLTINLLKPYPNWQTFKDLIGRMLTIYRDITHPKGFRRIGLRYINRIEPPKGKVKIEDYLATYPIVPPDIPQTYAHWFQRIVIPFERSNGLLILHAGSIHDEQQRLAFLLDLDFGTLQGETVTLDQAIDWLEQAHTEIEQVFEACITDKARVLFEEVTTNV